MTERQTTPTALIAILGMLGLYAVSKGPQARDGASKDQSAAAAKQAEPATFAYAEVENPLDPASGKEDMEIFAPLIDSLAGAGGVRDERKRTFKEFMDRVNTTSSAPTARCMIATIPDPVRCTNSFRFDELLDAIERAAAARSFVLDRWNFPWAGRGERISGSGSFRPRLDKRGFRLEAESQTEQTSLASEAKSARPGLIVFKGKYAARSPKARATDTDYLLVFLVSETPTYGLDQRAMVRVLDDTERIERKFSANFLNKANAATLRIIGPNFTGVMTSLDQALLTWLAKKTEDAQEKQSSAADSYSIEVISAGATQANKEYFETLPDRLKQKPPFKVAVEFHATIHTSKEVIRSVLDYLDPHGSQATAIFYEANTGGVQEIFHQIEKEDINNTNRYFYTYPLDVAQIRRIYDSQGLLREGTAEVVRSPGQLNSASDQGEQARDVVPDQTTGVSAD